MRVAAILGPRVRAGTVERFAAPGVELERVAGFQELPEGPWDAVLVFGGDGTVHLHLRELHERRIPMLVVPVGSGNDFAEALGIGSVSTAEAAWREFCGGGGNVREIDLGEIRSCSPQRAQREANAGPSTARGQDSRAPLGMTNLSGAEDAEDRKGRKENAGPSTARGQGGRAALGMTNPLVDENSLSTEDTEGTEDTEDRKGRKENAGPSTARGQGGRAPLGMTNPLQDENRQLEIETSVLFCCIGGAGLDADTNRRANAMPRWLRGHGGYALAAVAEIARWRAVGMKVEISGPSGQSNTEGREALQGPATLVAFANASSYGHGMKMAPRALLDDGRLDVCFVRQTTKRRLLRFFPSVFSGGHLALPEVEYRQAEWVRVETERPMAVYADGEYVCETPVEVRVVARGLCVIVEKF